MHRVAGNLRNRVSGKGPQHLLLKILGAYPGKADGVACAPGASLLIGKFPAARGADEAIFRFSVGEDAAALRTGDKRLAFEALEVTAVIPPRG